MNTQKVGNIKIPKFDREHYTLWKRKMTLFLRASNSKYQTILENGIPIPVTVIEAIADENGNITHPARRELTLPENYTEEDKDWILLENSLQLIIVDSLDHIMYNHVVNCLTAKAMWETIETINENKITSFILLEK